ncbi:hypothetical protein LK07_08765 [Streptomyces pluripotens]|uniref:Large membrane protein n=1 Tax=Streptomyces pluripotens TaxID=1355015 RepID=A0A221NW18_9ACTN|nr:hypothetical protein [Streptomyces pluripotens]ARP69855.1 hypothetical protein LK06_007660 [Streptomyces pluripotens]ASN24112.1 hypothetical protein LK07_08765 [Streptomyces pluripotens]
MNTERPENPGEPEVPETSGACATEEPRSDDGNPGKRPWWRRSPLVVASVAATVLLVGGGGAYLTAGGGGGRTGPGASGGGTTPPPLALDNRTNGGTEGIAPGEPDPYGARYVARGDLPEGPDSAPVYRPGADVGKEQVVRLAQALGVEGAPVAEGRIWRVGGKDGSGPSLQVHRDAPGNWTFNRYAPGTDNCKRGAICAHDPMAPAGTPVSVAEAEKAAAPALKAAGLDGATIDATQIMGAQRVVTADPVVGGLPTYGWTTGLTVDRQGRLVGGHGLLGTLVKGDTYPVLDAAKTLKLMNGTPKNDHRMRIGGCASPVPLRDRLGQPCGASTGVPKRGPETVTIEKAVFGLAAHSVHGRQALVPSWLFQARGSEARGAFTVTHPAIDPSYLASASTAPPAQPSSAQPSSAQPSSAQPSSAQPSSAPKDRNVKVNGYTADDRELTVSFFGGVCADYTASARESDERVTVTVAQRPWPDKVCPLIVKEYVQTVQLDQPLNGRTVVGADGEQIPRTKPGALRPSTSTRAR